jgi:hypothetical protein
MQMMDIDLLENNHLYADSAYLKQRFQRIIGKIATNLVQSGYPKEFSKKNDRTLTLEINYFRKTIENTLQISIINFLKNTYRNFCWFFIKTAYEHYYLCFQ